MTEERQNTQIFFTDFSISNWTLILALFMIALVIISPKKKDVGVIIKAEYIIQIDWPKDYDADVDIWVRGPEKEKVSYLNKASGLMQLDHDSQGSPTEKTKNAEVQSQVYSEFVTLRGVEEGVYDVNIHLYGINHTDSFGNTSATHAPGEPYDIPVHVRITKLNPNVEVKFEKTVWLHHVWEEITVLNFGLTRKGEWGGSTDEQVELFEPPSPGAGGAYQR